MQTKIYIAETAPLQDERVFRQLYSMASAERKAKIDRYRFQKDRLQSLCAEGLLLYAWTEAGHALPLPPCSYGAYGKPLFAGVSGFCFNLSHSGEYAMLAVSDTEIGCDVERIRPVGSRLMKRVLTPAELSVLTAVKEAERDELFFRYWVLKESCMKAVGKGLSLDPRSIEITLGPTIRASGEALPSPLTLREGALPGYRYAVCRSGNDARIRTEFISAEAIADSIGGIR